MEVELASSTAKVKLSPLLKRLNLFRNIECKTSPDNCDRIYYGIIDQGVGVDNGGLAYLGIKVSLGQIVDGGFYGRNRHAHEIAHNMGIDHTNNPQSTLCYKADSSEPQFVYLEQVDGADVAAIGPLDEGFHKMVYGWDSNQKLVLDPTDTFELMSYCGGDRWISKVTYNKVRTYINDNYGSARRLQGGGAQSETCFYRVNVNLDSGETNLLPIVRVLGAGTTPSSSPGDYKLVLKDGLGRIVNEVSFKPALPSLDIVSPSVAEDLEPVAQGLVALGCDASVSRVEVLDVSWLELASVTASENAPTVHVTYPNGGEILSGTHVEILWDADDIDGDDLEFVVEFSANGGSSWTTLAVDHSYTSLTVSLSDLGKSLNGLVRVTATDGFLAGRDQSDAVFVTPNSPPTVEVDIPGEGAVFVGVQPVTLRAFTMDTEDGILNNADIVWSSNIDGTLGSGEEIQILASDLTEGVHAISVTGMDSSGASVTDSVSISINRLIVPSVPRICQASRRTLGITLSGNSGGNSHKYLRSRNPRGPALQSEPHDPCGGACDHREDCALDLATNTHTCICKPGFFYNEEARYCMWLDECATASPCPGPVDSVTSSFCVDYAPPVRFKCGCLQGFTAILPSDASIISDPVPPKWRPEACVDVDECLFSESPCHANATCTNTIGSFSCSCKAGFTGDGFSCVLEATEAGGGELPSEPCNGRCRIDFNQVCMPSRVNPGSFACLCEEGFSQLREGGGCSDINECDPKNPSHDCDINAHCHNIPGTYLCVCLPGFVGGGREGQCIKTTASPTAPPTLVPTTSIPTVVSSNSPGVVSVSPPAAVCLADNQECTDDADCCSGSCA